MAGYITAIVVAVLTICAAVVAMIVAGVSGFGDDDKYGKVAVPGQGRLELPAEEVTVFYEENVTLGDAQSLNPPGGLSYSVRPAGGGPPLELDDAGFDEEIGSSGTTKTSIAKVDPPAAGSYLVVARLKGQAGPDPALTFGEGLFSGLFDRAKPIFLWACAGILLSILIAVGTFVFKRLSHEDERVTMPPGGAA